MLGIRYKIDLNPNNNFKRLMVAFNLINQWEITDVFYLGIVWQTKSYPLLSLYPGLKEARPGYILWGIIKGKRE